MVRAYNPGNEADRLISNRSQQSELRFYVIGDFGSGDEGQAKVAEAMAIVAAREPPDFIIGTGDCFYPLADEMGIDGTSRAPTLAERFDAYYGKIGVDFFQSVGNEDLVNVFGGDAMAMVAHTWRSSIWRMPAVSYRIPWLPPWATIHVAHTNVFGFGMAVAEETEFSNELMEREINALTETFESSAGFKILIGHHPIFTAGKRTFRYSGDGELLYMRRLRRVIEDCGVHFYFSGHEHHQSHITGPTCEHIVQGCGGARTKPNPKHLRRQNGWRDTDKILHYMDVIGGFAVVDIDADYRACVRFFGVRWNEPAHTIGVIYEHRWQSLADVGDRTLRRLAKETDGPLIGLDYK